MHVLLIPRVRARARVSVCAIAFERSGVNGYCFFFLSDRFIRFIVARVQKENGAELVDKFSVSVID